MAPREGWTAQAIMRALLPSEMRRLLDSVKPLQREDRVGKLIGAPVEHRAREGQKFLRHRLRVRK